MTDEEKRIAMEEVDKYLQKKKDKDAHIEAFKGLFVFVTTILLIIAAVLMIIYRTKNPELTETQLLLYSIKKHWWLFIMYIVAQIMYINR